MGCTYDIIETKLSEKEHAEKFLELFNEILEEDLYDGKIDFDYEEVIEEMGEEFYILIENEPLFDYFDEGVQISYLVFNFLKAVPEAELELTYNCTFNNCGDQLVVKYEYKDNLLKMTSWYADFFLLGCPECGVEWDEPIYSLEGEDECPSCGADLELAGVDVEINEIPLVNGEWQYPEDWEGYDIEE